MAENPLALRTWPVRPVIAGMVVTAMFFVATVLITLNWFSARSLLIDSAVQTSYYASHAASEHARRLIEPASATLRTLSFDPLVTASRQPERLTRMRLLAAELIANPLVSAIYVGYANGDFLLIRPLEHPEIRQQLQAPESASYLVQMVTRNPEELPVGVFYFYDANLDLVAQRHLTDYQFDPRERGWYQKAQGRASTVLSDPYLFFSTRQVGISLSQLTPASDAVVGLDITLHDLGENLAKLRITPGTELALVDGKGAVIAYSGMSLRTDSAQALTPSAPVLRTVDALPSQALSALRQIGKDGVPVSYTSEGQAWLGVSLPFDALNRDDMRMLLTVPAAELLGGLQDSCTRMILIAGGLILLCLPLGWWAGSRIGQSLEHVTAQAKRMSSFDFSRPPTKPTPLREVAELNHVMNHVSATVGAFLSISQVLGSEPQIEAMLNLVLEKLVRATRCQGGAIYLSQQDEATMTRFAVVGDLNELGPELHYVNRPRSATPHPGKTGARVQRIEFQLQGRTGEIEGMLVLLYEDDQEHASPEFHAFAAKLTGMMTVAIETRQLIESQKQLFDAVIHVLADAIDAKSPYTGGHCERVPELAIRLANSLDAETTGPYADFRLTDEERYAFFLAAWLHDCGKITSAEHIVDKSTKLELIYNRIHEIRMRFEVLWRDAEITYLQALLQGEDAAAAAAARDQWQAQLQQDFAFVAACNIGGESLQDEAIERLQRLGATTWWRHFDDSLGLSTEESTRLRQHRDPSPDLPVAERLLADKPEHCIAWGEHKPAVERGDPHNTLGFDMQLPAYRQHRGELHNLSIRRGTLTAEDRFAINEHMVHTLDMLKKLPWPRHLARVPDIAANHHERMDGSGYPRRLPGSAMQTTERIMAVADIFEALTAADRPYKPAKTISESLRIMAVMGKDGHIDPELFLYFLHSRVWQDYVAQYLRPEQIDAVDVTAIAGILQT